jgi:predicted phage terminase large subunit-like protein
MSRPEDGGEATGDQFDVVKYPALAEEYEYLNTETNSIERFKSSVADFSEADKLGRTRPELLKFIRAPGEALHPERYSAEMLRRYKDGMPRRTWSALYQQNPVPDEGMYFQKPWLKFEALGPTLFNRNVYQAWDFAIGEKQHNDYNVGVCLVQDEQDYLHVVDITRFRGDSFQIVEEILSFAEKWGSEPSCPLTLGFEDGQIWKAIKPLLHSRMEERKLFPAYEELKTLTDKMARARSLQGRLQQGRVWFPLNEAWIPDVQRELLRFPAGAHDDIVDALAHAVNLCVSKSPKYVASRHKPLPSWKDRLNSFLGKTDVTHMGA